MRERVVGVDEFVAMPDRARALRAEVGKLGFRGSEVDANITPWLYWDPRVRTLAVGHEALGNEIHTLLSDARLSAQQAAQLEHAYFPPRERT